MIGMTETDSGPLPQIRRRWRIPALLALVAVLTAVWFIRAEMWPCGALDKTSGCVSSVVLDVAAVGIDPSATYIPWGSFDLSSGGKLALVGLRAPLDERGGVRTVLATFDAEAGAPLQVLHDSSGNIYTGSHSYIDEVAALSRDASLVAARIVTQEVDGALHSALNIYRLSDGRLISVLRGDNYNCNDMLDFGSDGERLQCGRWIFDVESGAGEQIADADGNFRRPMLADSSGSVYEAIAPDTTRIKLSELESATDSADTSGRLVFAPDSTGLLEVQNSYSRRGVRRFFPPGVFHQMSAVSVWHGKTKTLQRSFFSNRRYIRTAWSRDSAYFGFVSNDLQLEVFKR